ncbi:hypothetical protein Jiend_27560 [Micromonospora endophytica]|nr:hypothetical protein Jiend_27560 [Micromonospora endophytica]
MSTTGRAVVFFALGVGDGLAVRGLLRDGAFALRVGVGLALALALGLGDALALGLDEALPLGDALPLGVAGSTLGARSTAGVRSDSPPAVRCTAPTVPPTARATATAALATRPVGEVILRVRKCLPVTGPVLSFMDQIGSDHNERSTSEVNVIMMVCP